MTDKECPQFRVWLNGRELPKMHKSLDTFPVWYHKRQNKKRKGGVFSVLKYPQDLLERKGYLFEMNRR